MKKPGKLTKAQKVMFQRVREINDRGQCAKHLPTTSGQGKTWEVLDNEGLIAHVWGDAVIGGGWIATDHSLLSHPSIQGMLNKRILNHTAKKERLLEDAEREQKAIDAFKALLRT